MNRWPYLSLVAICALPCIAFSNPISSSSPAEIEDDTNSIIVCDPRALSNLLIDVSEMTVSSVVTVKATATIEETQPIEFPWDTETAWSGFGSGVIIREDGYIVTNSHILGDAEELIVTLPSGEDVPAILVGSDPGSDIALIKIETDVPVQPIEFGNSDDLRVGEMILSIGSPFALSQTVSLGIVSYLDRSCPGLANCENFIQTDSAINP